MVRKHVCSLTNVSSKDADDAILKNEKRDYIFGLLTGESLTGGVGVAAGATGAAGVGTNEERIVGRFDTLAEQGNVASLLANMVSVANTASTITITAGATANSAV